jgi:hypothetical protein
MAMMTSINVKPRARAESFIFCPRRVFGARAQALRRAATADRNSATAGRKPRASPPADEIAVRYFTTTDLKSSRQRCQRTAASSWGRVVGARELLPERQWTSYQA